MAHIPASVLLKNPPLEGLELRHQGKVRDSYNLPGHPDKMLVVASDRCSIFNHVLPFEVQKKGEVLTAINHFWTTQVISDLFDTDFIAGGVDIDKYLPEHLREHKDLQRRGTVVRIVQAPDVEDIVRNILTGSGWDSYKEWGSICGHRLPSGLTDGSMLPFPIYTPTTKAEVGDGEHITADSVTLRYGHLRERKSLQAAGLISSYAAKRGVILADTKFEFGLDAQDNLVLVDEKGTPDSSRFVDAKLWEQFSEKGKFPPSLDKQYVREWGKSVGIDKLKPTNPEHCAIIDALEVPTHIIEMTTRIYRYIFWRLTGLRIETYQEEHMGIINDPSSRKIEIVVGSASDQNQMHSGLDELCNTNTKISVLSCHRNLDELVAFAKEKLTRADVVIAGAGMAAALPGMIKAALCSIGRSDIPVIGVGFLGDNKDHNLAAKLSIECLPGQPVELDENGLAYLGQPGFYRACCAARDHEFLPKAFTPKPSQIHDEKLFD